MTSRLFLSCATAAVLLGGCVDPEGKYDDFAKRVGTKVATVSGCDGGGSPPAPGPDVDGFVLLAVSTSISPKLPVLFRGSVTSSDAGGKTALSFSLTPLDAGDRTTPVGAPLNEGPFVIDNGILTAEIPRGITPGAANPITFSDIDAQVTIKGAVCQTAQKWTTGAPLSSCQTQSPCNFYCGVVSGETFAPITGPLTGEFAMIRLMDETAQPEPPPYNCAGDLADPAPTPP